jgi:hypothetical protein
MRSGGPAPISASWRPTARRKRRWWHAQETRRGKPGIRIGLDLPFRNIERSVQGANRLDALEAFVAVPSAQTP